VKTEPVVLALPWPCGRCGHREYELVRDELVGPVTVAVLACTECGMGAGLEFACLDVEPSREKSVPDMFREIGFLELKCPACGIGPIMQNPIHAGEIYVCPKCEHEAPLDDFKLSEV